MTAGGDFISGDGREFDSAPNYPTIFGLKLTPTVSGTLIALVGLGLAVWLFINLVQPEWQKGQALEADIKTKEATLQASQETKRQLEEAKTKLKDSEQLKADVLTLFATEKSMDTLLLDLNERVQSANAGITVPERRASLSKFTKNDTATGTVNDSSLGPAINGKLNRQVYDVQMTGSFAQTQSIIRSIERLQPLLVVKNLNSQLDTSTQAVVLNDRGQLVPNGQPVTRINTSFQLNALIPIEIGRAHV